MVYNEIQLTVFTIVFGIFGSLLGSFSNVVILRMASKTSVVFPPSSCPKCNHQLSAFDLIPVLSWVYLRGKCRYCKCQISWQYPVVEATIAAILASSFHKFGFTPDFIPFASMSVIWFVASVIFIRQEVTSPLPYLWPIPIFLLFKLFTGHLALKMILSGLALGFVCSALSTFKDHFKNWGAWFGLTFLLYASLSYVTRSEYAFIIILPTFLNIFPETRKAAFYLLFALSIAGNIATHILA